MAVIYVPKAYLLLLIAANEEHLPFTNIFLSIISIIKVLYTSLPCPEKSNPTPSTTVLHPSQTPIYSRESKCDGYDVISNDQVANEIPECVFIGIYYCSEMHKFRGP